jgi:hypothetical protein
MQCGYLNQTNAVPNAAQALPLFVLAFRGLDHRLSMIEFLDMLKELRFGRE